MKAIIDCNNFYCSCERLFMPHLVNRPVVVLSNNDGCIVSRSDEAKKLGVSMAGPYFMAKPTIEKYGVSVFSSNYHLYGDMSWRVMETVRSYIGEKNVEVYSVDEAFADLTLFKPGELSTIAQEIRERVEKWTGITVSIGVAPTKVLSKVANRIAKKNKAATQCVVVLCTPLQIEEALRQTAIEDVWGIGRRYAQKLKEDWSIYDAYQLSQMSEEFGRKYLGGVVGVRLIKELRGESVKDMEEELTIKKMIASTRMFGHSVTDLKDIKEAVATYTARAAEKLRRQFSACKTVTVFLVAKSQDPNVGFRGNSHYLSVSLPIATSHTHELIKPALQLVEEIYRAGTTYKKAGVILGEMVPDYFIQGNLFLEKKTSTTKKLMEMVDNINFSQRDDVLKFASTGTTRNWKMRQELRSPRYTTRWDELYELK